MKRKNLVGCNGVMVPKSISVDFAKLGMCTVILHPALIATETRKGGWISVIDSVSGTRNVIGGLDLEMTERFLTHHGARLNGEREEQ